LNPPKESFYTSLEVFLLPFERPIQLGREFSYPSKESFIFSKESFIFSKESFIFSKESFIFSKETL
jgi:hypothetical protein